MAKKYTNKDLFSGSLFGTAIAEAKEWLEVMKTIIAIYKEYGTTAKKEVQATNELSSEGIEATTKAVKELKTETEALSKAQEDEIKAVKQLSKLEKEELKLKQALVEGTTDQAKANDRLRELLLKQKKERKIEAKGGAKVIGLYAKQSKELRRLKNEYKNATLEGKKTAEELKDMRDAVTDLDASLRDLDKQVGDSYREIGKYEEALEGVKEKMEELDNTAKKLGVFALIVAIASIAGDFFGESREASKASAKAMAEFTERVKVTVASLIDAFSGVIDIITASWEIIGSRFEQYVVDPIARGMLRLEIIAQNINFSTTYDDAKEAVILANIVKLEAEMTALESKTYDLTEANAKLDKGIDDVVGAFEGDLDAMEDAVDLAQILIEKKSKLGIANLDLQKNLAKLSQEQERQAVISEDDTRGFDERIEASIRWQKQNEEVAKAQEKIAKNNLEIARLEVASDLVRATRLTLNEALLMSADQMNAKLLETGIRQKISVANDEAFTDAFVAFNDARTESLITTLDTEEKVRKLESDRVEKNLDILIDGADNQKGINERIIGDERQTLLTRQKLITDTELMLRTSFEKQKLAILEFGQIQIETNSELSADEKERQLNVLKGADIDDLVRTKDAVALQEKIRLMGLSEIFEGRLLEVIRDRRTATLDLLEVQKDFNETQRKTAEIVADIVEQEETLAKLDKVKNAEDIAKIEEDLQKKRQENRVKAIDSEIQELKDFNEAKKKLLEEEYLGADNERSAEIEKEIDALEGKSERELELEKEKNDILIDQKKALKEEELKLEEEKAEEIKEIQEGLFDILNEQLDKYYDKKFARIQADLDASKEQEDKLIEASELGVQLSEESIAFEREQQAELERERVQQEQKKIQAEFMLATLETLVANDGDIGKTATDMAFIRALSQTAPVLSAFDGIEDTGTGGNLDSKGGFNAILHPHERVMTAKQNEVIGGMSNEDLTSLAYMHNQGLPITPQSNAVSLMDDNHNELINEIKDLPKNMPVTSLHLGVIEGYVTERIRQQGRITNNHHKINRLLN